MRAFADRIAFLKDGEELTLMPPMCDRNSKQDFEEVDGSAVLKRLRDLDVTTWRYRPLALDAANASRVVDNKSRHMSPTAQDFYAAFDVGQNDMTISPIDTSGVMFVGIQELADEVEGVQAMRKNTHTRVQKMKARTAALFERLRSA